MKLKTLFATAILAFSAQIMAAGVMMEMFQMNKQLRALNQAESVEKFQESAKAFIDISEKAKNTMPASLEGDQERFKGYQAGMQETIDVVKKAEAQAKEGKLAEAKETISQLDSLKKQYHKEYKN